MHTIPKIRLGFFFLLTLPEDDSWSSTGVLVTEISVIIEVLYNRLLTLCFQIRISINNSNGMTIAMGFEGLELEEVRDYIQRDVPFGDIIPGSPDFQKMERASNEVILKLNWKDLESGQKPSLEKIFVSGSFKDVDEAKRLSAYMGKALRCDIGRDDSLKMVLDRVQGSTLFEIMRACKVGIYQARQIQQLLKGQ